MISFVFRIIKNIFVLLVLGCIYFVYKIPSEPTTNHEKTDAIIVLTGGTHRVETGFKILSAKKAQKLFISGVHNKTKLKELLVLNDQDIYSLLRNEIELGKKASSTKENATEAYNWIKKNKVKSIRLVTSNYHIPRSIFEFERILPEVKIIPNPVFSNNFQKHNWWRHYTTAKLIVKEYIKFLYIAGEYYYYKLTN